MFGSWKTGMLRVSGASNTRTTAAAATGAALLVSDRFHNPLLPAVCLKSCRVRVKAPAASLIPTISIFVSVTLVHDPRRVRRPRIAMICVVITSGHAAALSERFP